MLWVVVALSTLAVVLLLIGVSKAMAPRSTPGKTESSVSSDAEAATADDAPALVEPFAPPMVAAAAGAGVGREPSRPVSLYPAAPDDGGTTMEANAPRIGARVSLQSASTEIDISFDDIADGPILDDEPTGPVPRILVSAVGGTDQGKKRKHNEDAFVVLPSHSLFAIADGMGGYAAGEVASQMAMDILRDSFERETFGGAPIPGLPKRGDELVRAIQTANLAILTQARQNEAQAGMGTTLVAARFAPNRKRVYIAHVGDSRIYRLRDGRLEQLTTDHTLGAAGVTGPSAQKLSRAVGVFDDVEVDLNIDEPRLGDHYVLCSDGLFKMVPDDKICSIIYGADTIEHAVDELIREANSRGGKDNVSVILVRVDEPDERMFN
jgi:serine/threonine protein phosphatase PrpC